MNLKQASDIAVAICTQLQPYCSKINIAGSIRRKKPEVKDIEVIAVPKQLVTTDLFGEPIGSVIDPGFIRTVAGLGIVIKGQPTGRYIQIDIGAITLDFFLPDPVDYYRQYCIRTGSADYVARVIAGGWKRLGWCGSDKGLRRISDCVESVQPDGKSKWKCVRSHAEEPPVWGSEQEFYQWLGVPYIEPKMRNL